MTLALTEAFFIELPTHRPEATVSRVAALEPLALAVTTNKGFAFGNYRICQGQHAVLSSTRTLMDWRHRPGVALAIFEGKTVGLTRSDLTWIEEEHRGNGIGPQMVAEFFVSQGAATWDKKMWVYRLSQAALTSGGLENRRRVFHVLVKRGIIKDAGAAQ